MWNCTCPYPTPGHGSKKLFGHCNNHVLDNGINLLLKLHDGCQKDLPNLTRERERLSKTHLCQVARYQPGCRNCTAEVNNFTSEWRNFWKEGWGNLNIPMKKKGTSKLLHYFALDITMNHITTRGSGNHRSEKYTNWINDEKNE